MSSAGRESEALQKLRRELQALHQQGDSDATDDDPPVAELEALALSLSKLKLRDPVPFDRKRTWEVIEKRINGDATED